MSKDLHIALQEAIGNLGTDVLKSPYLVNIFQDYGAFDVHDKHSLVIKQWLVDLVKDGIVVEIVSWKKLLDKEMQNKGLSMLMQYNDTDDVRYVINSVLMACGLPNISIPPSAEAQSNPLYPQKPIVASNINTPQTQPATGNDKFSGKNIGCAIWFACISPVRFYSAFNK